MGIAVAPRTFDTQACCALTNSSKRVLDLYELAAWREDRKGVTTVTVNIAISSNQQHLTYSPVGTTISAGHYCVSSKDCRSRSMWEEEEGGGRNGTRIAAWRQV